MLQLDIAVNIDFHCNEIVKYLSRHIGNPQVQIMHLCIHNTWLQQVLLLRSLLKVNENSFCHAILCINRGYSTKYQYLILVSKQ